MNKSLAKSFARTDDHETGTVIEIEVPSLFFDSSYNPSIKDPIELEKMGATEGTISKYNIINLSPFIKRVGVLVPGRGADEAGINWISFEEAVKVGFFEDNFNYKKYFKRR